MKKRSTIEMTLRAVVDGKKLGKAKLPPDVTLTAAEAAIVANWARPISGTCLMDMDIHVSDIKPSNAFHILSDLGENLAGRLRNLVTAARRYGFGMRIMRDDPTMPYQMSIYRRTIDIPQLTVPHSSMNSFLKALGFIDADDTKESDARETTMNLEIFGETLVRRYDSCMDAGFGHYQSYCMQIVEYGKANGATEILWGPERRGAITVDER